MHIPNPHRAIRSATNQHRTLHTEAQTPHPALPMAAHILDQPPERQIPKTDPPILVRTRQDLPIRTARQCRHTGRMAREHAHGAAVRQTPHPDRLVATRREDVGGVGMESDDVDAVVVAGQEAQMADLVRRPDPGGLVVASRDEVVAEGTPLQVPDRADVAFIHDDLLEDVEVPEADCAICAGGEEPFGAWLEIIWRGRGGGRWGEGDGVDGAGVADQSVRSGWHVVAVGFDGFSVKAPDADI